MPLGPGADLLDVSLRAVATSVSVMGGQLREGRGCGSSGWLGSTLRLVVGKKRRRKASAFSAGSFVSVPSSFHRAGKKFVRRPLRWAAISQILFEFAASCSLA